MTILDTIVFYLKLTLFIIVFLIVCQLGYISVKNYDVIVKVKNEVVYEGKIYKIWVSSTGDTTLLTIKGGFLGIFPKETYNDKDITITTKKKRPF